MNSEILLIGPIGSGKSTVAELLYERTMLPHRSMDLLRWKYFDEIGYDREIARERYVQNGFWGLYHYWKPFEVHAVCRMLEDFSECIFDFGGSQTVYEEDDLFEQVRRVFEPYPHVILFLPSPDPEESIRILHARNQYASEEQWAVNELFIRHHSNYDLAKYIAYTKDKTPEQTCDEVLQWVRSNGWTYEP
ncbi:MAG: shikimate kinase [Chloroflexi bacterium]|nr:shikimate kinase [Chloroflexota bacterium]